MEFDSVAANRHSPNDRMIISEEDHRVGVFDGSPQIALNFSPDQAEQQQREKLQPEMVGPEDGLFVRRALPLESEERSNGSSHEVALPPPSPPIGADCAKEGNPLLTISVRDGSNKQTVAGSKSTSNSGLASITEQYRKQKVSESPTRGASEEKHRGATQAGPPLADAVFQRSLRHIPNDSPERTGNSQQRLDEYQSGEGGRRERSGNNDDSNKPKPKVVTAQRARVAGGPAKETSFAAQRHAIWRQHVDRLYDFYAQHFLEYPTSTVQFVPESRVRFPAEYAMHQLYTGTVSPTRNYLCAYHAYVPSEMDEEDKEFGEEDRTPGENEGKYTDVANILQPVLKVAHDGPIQRIRVNPYIPSLVACRGRKQTLSLYQLADYGVDDVNKGPTVTLRGPRQAGHGIAWNNEESNLLAACANDGMVYVYDVNANIEVTAAADDEGANNGGSRRTGNSTGPLMGLAGHADIAYDVSWHPTQTHTLMSCDANGKVVFWDTRSKSKEFGAEVHLGPALSCSFHPSAIFSFVTSGADGFVRVWDFRKLHRPAYNLVGHRDAVLGAKWAPFNSAVLLSHSCDGSVILWDLAKAGTDPIPGVDDTMKPEMVFQHFGHMGPVRDAQWCEHNEDPWTVVSVDDFNTVQLWSPAPNAYNNMQPDDSDED